MRNPDTLRQIMRDKQLASLGDAYVNFIYSLALTKIDDRPQAVKVSDRILAEAFKLRICAPILEQEFKGKIWQTPVNPSSSRHIEETF